MIEHIIRPVYQRWLVDPIVEYIGDRLSPITVTILSGLCGSAVWVALSLFSAPYWAVLFLLLSGYCDTLDGSIARAQQKASPIGASLDITVDRLVEFFIIYALFSVDPQGRGHLCFLLLGSILFCVTTFLVVGIFTKVEGPTSLKKSFYYSPGLIERPEAFAFFGIMILWPQAFIPLSFMLTGLILYTGSKRLFYFVRVHS